MSLGKLTGLNLLMLLFCFIHRADGQVTFHYNQGPQEIDLRCDVGSLGLTNFTHLDSLVISRLSTGQWQVLASLSAHYAQNGPVSNAPDAKISGQISSTGSSSSFLQIVWNNAQPQLEGDYKCEVYGVDSNFRSASIEEELKLQEQKGELLFFTMPDTISLGLSPRLDINCSTSDLNALNVSVISSLSILRIHEGVEQILAEIKSGHDVYLDPGADSVIAEGSLDSNEGFIAMGWSIPGMDQAGVYICEAIGIDTQGGPVLLSRRSNVTWQEPSRQALVTRLGEMYHTKTDLENRLVIMNQTKAGLENRLINMSRTKADLENHIVKMNHTQADLENRLGDAETLARDATVNLNLLLNNTVCAKSCDDLTLPVGQHEVILVHDNIGVLKVLCDVRGPNETWTIFQKRFDGSVDFYRNFIEYENGFGSTNGEHWLGLKHIKRLLDASGRNHELRVDMVLASNGTRHTRIYPTFSIGPGDNYTLTVAGYDDGGAGMSDNSGAPFSTYDHGPVQFYAKQGWYSSGWWFNAGSHVNLNGVWGITGKVSSIYWQEIEVGFSATLSETEMKFRSRD